MGTRTAAAATAPEVPWNRHATGTKATSAASDPRAVSPANRPKAKPASSTAAPAGALTKSAPMAGEMPLPPAPRNQGDQLWPATAHPPANAPRRGRRRASAGPSEPFATSNIPVTTRAPTPATCARPVPETVPLPNWRRSTPARRRATRLDSGTDPARKPTAAGPSTLARPTHPSSSSRRLPGENFRDMRGPKPGCAVLLNLRHMERG